MKTVMNYKNPGIWLCFLLLLASGQLLSQVVLELKDAQPQEFIGKYLGTSDDTSIVTYRDALNSTNFKPAATDVPNLGVTPQNHWVKFTVLNGSDKTEFIIQLALATIDYVDYYAVFDNGRVDSIKTGDCRPLRNRGNERPDFAFKLSLNAHEKVQVLFKLNGGEQVQVPLKIGEQAAMLKSFSNQDALIGIYSGIILTMLLYNFFVFFSTRDKSYLFYVIYIFTVGLTQLNFLGYSYKYFWPNSVYVSNMAVYILSSLTAITSIEFMKRFLFTKTKCYTLHKYFVVFYIIYYIAIAMALFKKFNWSYQVIQINATLAASYILVVAWQISKQGYRPAKFFLLAWSTFLIGVCVFVFKDLGILPYNNVTFNTMPIGSAFEVILLSLALADRINILRKEKVELLTENERIIKEQNISLEIKVKERTAELEASNKSLKEAEAHLINVEKMASLGQLTAGISHEINNPINFVISNIKPLRRDVEDILLILSKYAEIKDEKGLSEKLEEIEALKTKIDSDYLVEEINLLLKGIDEGAYRTSEIVKGLKNFSRSDDSHLKTCNVHYEMDATLTILNNSIANSKITVRKEYGDLPNIECYPGKLNQVFMNIFNNAIQAISEKNTPGHQGLIIVKTEPFGDHIQIRIKDNGVGISPKNLTKLFEPFFTTKPVGMGTGLGLSIVYGIIKSHKGEIKIESEEGKGAEFIITLPVHLIS
jgi:two-component system NtrC family sensor kinase